MTGPQEWLENVTGAGTTNGIYKLFFVGIIIVGVLYGTGFGYNVLSFLFSPFVNLIVPKS